MNNNIGKSTRLTRSLAFERPKQRKKNAANLIQTAIKQHMQKIKALPTRVKYPKGNLGVQGELSTTVEPVFEKLLESIKNRQIFQSEEYQTQLEHLISLYQVQQGPLPGKFETDVKYGRTTFLTGSNLAVKSIKESENPADLQKELGMQWFLCNKKAAWGLRSDFPEPVGMKESQRGEMNHDVNPVKLASLFKAPEGYYHYLSDIEDNEMFKTAIGKSAHDLGRLLIKGIGFQQLISLFHQGAADRQYTCFPNLLKVAVMINHPEFAGKLESVVGLDIHLYENMGQSGLRDLGDMVFLDQWSLPDGTMDFEKSRKSGTLEKNYHTYSDAQKLMHFVSLYCVVFSILIAKRAEKFQSTDPNIWDQSGKLYKSAVTALLSGLNLSDVKLVPMNEIYFNKQLEFGFRSNRLNPDLEEFSDYKEILEKFNDEEIEIDTVPTKPSKVQLKDTFGPGVVFEEPFIQLHTNPLTSKLKVSFVAGTSYDKQSGFSSDGHLGTLQGPIPLLELMTHVYSQTACVLEAVGSK